MKITLLNKKHLTLLSGIIICGAIDITLLSHISAVWGNILFAILVVFQFYLTVEISNKVMDEPLVLDFRSEEAKKREEENYSQELLKGFRNNLLMKIAEGQLSSEKATVLFEEVLKFEINTNPKALEEAKLIHFTKQLTEGV
jgi:uncharacterized membrane protein YfcA